jgi:hypothetical protein
LSRAVFENYKKIEIKLLKIDSRKPVSVRYAFQSPLVQLACHLRAQRQLVNVPAGAPLHFYLLNQELSDSLKATFLQVTKTMMSSFQKAFLTFVGVFRCTFGIGNTAGRVFTEKIDFQTHLP